MSIPEPLLYILLVVIILVVVAVEVVPAVILSIRNETPPDRIAPGKKGEVLRWQDGEGYVRVEGEQWAARSDKPLKPGDAIVILSREGLTLIVEAAPAA